MKTVTTKKERTQPTTNFSMARTAEEIVSYLDSDYYRLKDVDFVCHYTTLKSITDILESRYWHFSTPEGMNDKLEFENGDKRRWNNMFFGSFMKENKENIAMWSMYAQPWEVGVKIAIEKNAFRDWVKSNTVIYEVENKNVITNRPIHVNGQSEAKMYISAVAYSNATSLTEGEQEEMLYGRKAVNNNFHYDLEDKNSRKVLTGYIKDEAWSYEKEIRVKVEFDNRENWKQIAVYVPDQLISAMTIVSGPLFESTEDDLKILKSGLTGPKPKIGKSIFTGKFDYKDICRECKYKNEYIKAKKEREGIDVEDNPMENSEALDEYLNQFNII